ncbi:hypothetical protein AAJ76_1000157322 [Vairimorpha ceranae]|uniref:Uncharacterized protein n=1 Tax=Vairimorpha ceranae TaxID=40302 RepID=A0A0F9ZHL2_9MICR|nr:hypothetical protein AAJ76_1000157322 [Vairimorpha ceranae]KKO76709.1 hypothetical protein AAJ76_1000157322 [Vairimorpha ceranae]
MFFYPMKILLLKLQIIIKISPKYFNDPDTEINIRLSSFLFKYSHKLEGIPLSYKIIGIFPFGNIICDNECIYLKTVVEFTFLSFKIGDVVYANEGVVFGVICAKIDGNDFYTGNLKIKDIDNTNGECSVIIGEMI